jgi:hypothetical protein
MLRRTLACCHPAEDASLIFSGSAFYGYLRRNPDDEPDLNFTGYDFWLAKMNQFSLPGEDMRDATQALGRIQKSEMVRAFIESAEYRQRFGGAFVNNQLGPPVSAQPRQ